MSLLSPFPLLLATLFALSTSPQSSLCTWLAVQHLDPPVWDEEEATRLSKRKKWLIGVPVLLVVGWGEYWVYMEAGQVGLDRLVRVLAGFVIHSTLAGAGVELFGGATWAAFRAANGKTRWRIAPGTLDRRKTFGLQGVSALLTGWYLLGSSVLLLEAVVFSALLYRFASAVIPQRLSYRRIITWYRNFIIATAINIALAFIGYFRVAPEGHWVEEGDGRLSVETWDLITALARVVFTTGPFILLNFTYRFSHARHLARFSLPAPLPTPAERNLSPTLTPLPTPLPYAFIRPSPSSIPAFPKPLVLILPASAFLLLRLALALLAALSAEELGKVAGAKWVGMMVGCSIDLVVVLGATAGAVWMDGVGGELGEYEERWSWDKAVDPALVEMDGLGDKEDEAELLGATREGEGDAVRVDVGEELEGVEEGVRAVE